MKLKIFIALAAVALSAFIAVSQIENKPFAPAEDVPRGALIYVQIADLPAFVKLWNESDLKGKYTTSENFSDFRNNHLGLKILSRWEEFDQAAGFPIDLETVAKLADKRAALAVYDIGKLEFVFVAPLADEVFAATEFFQNKDKFAEETLPDGTSIYRAAVAADRGRQQQELIFTGAKNRFVLATSEKLLMQTLNNINGAAKAKNRLRDEPDFADLNGKIAAHAATVWVNQAALNDDYYFKHYWLMSEVKELKNIRAGIFDFEIREDALIETRRFTLDEAMNAAPLGKAQADAALRYVPENIPFYKLRKADRKTVDAAVEETIFERRDPFESDTRQNEIFPSEGYTSGDYEYLGDRFDEKINAVDGDEKTVEKTRRAFDFAEILQTAAPQSVLNFAAPQVSPAPRFVKFRRAAVFHLAAPNAFDRAAFESAIEKTFAERILVASPNVNLIWESKSENGSTRRELAFPMLGQTVVYAVRGDDLILSNDADFLSETLASRNAAKQISDRPFSELTVVNLEQKKAAFADVFATVNKGAATESDFFTGNVSSLLDSIDAVQRIEVRKNYSANVLEEELVFVRR